MRRSLLVVCLVVSSNLPTKRCLDRHHRVLWMGLPFVLTKPKNPSNNPGLNRSYPRSGRRDVPYPYAVPGRQGISPRIGRTVRSVLSIRGPSGKRRCGWVEREKGQAIERDGHWEGSCPRRHHSLCTVAERGHAAMKYNPSVTSSRRKNRKVRWNENGRDERTKAKPSFTDRSRRRWGLHDDTVPATGIISEQLVRLQWWPAAGDVGDHAASPGLMRFKPLVTVPLGACQGRAKGRDSARPRFECPNDLLPAKQTCASEAQPADCG